MQKCFSSDRVDKRAEVIVSTKIARKLERKPELVKALQELFEIEDDEHDDDTTDYNLVSNKKFNLPKLVVPFKDTSRGQKLPKIRLLSTLIFWTLAGVERRVWSTRSTRLLRSKNGGMTTTSLTNTLILQKPN